MVLKVLFVLYILCYAKCYKILDNEDSLELIWPETYHIKGEKISLTTGIKEPFEFWSSTELNKSRVDYYGGTVKMFYYWGNDYNISYTYAIHPETTEEVTNEIVCKMSSGYGGGSSLLPETFFYQYKGEEEVDGKVAQKWSYVSTEEDVQKVTDTLWTVKSGQNYIPLRHEVLEFNLWKQSLTSHYITEYYTYFAEIHEDDLDAERDVECIDEFELGAEKSNELVFYNPNIDGHLDKAFNRFKLKHGKEYKNINEHNFRRSVFKNNLQRIISRNRQNLPYKLGVNHLTDLTREELHILTSLWSKPNEVGSLVFPYSHNEVKDLFDNEAIPKEVDLRLEGVVTPVKNQDMCGSCWAFSTAAAIEGALARTYEKLISISEQAFVDCAWGFGNGGCEGGLLSGAFKWATKHGVTTTEQYGLYKGINGYCELGNTTDVYKIRGFAEVTPYSENSLKVAVYKHGPVAVAIYASDDMYSYESGVFYDPACLKSSVNHGVTVVGYGEKYGESYWIIKNSWGESWGENGFIRLSTKNDNCNVQSSPCYAVV